MRYNNIAVVAQSPLEASFRGVLMLFRLLVLTRAGQRRRNPTEPLGGENRRNVFEVQYSDSKNHVAFSAPSAGQRGHILRM